MSQTRDELEAAIEARREVGAELEPHVIDGFVERIEKRIDERARQLQPRRGPSLVFPLASLVLAIPLLGVAGGTAGLAGIVVVCLAIVLVNLIATRR